MFQKKNRKLHLCIFIYILLYNNKVAMVDEANCAIKIHLNIIMSWCSENIFLWLKRKDKVNNNMKIIKVAILIFRRPT